MPKYFLRAILPFVAAGAVFPLFSACAQAETAIDSDKQQSLAVTIYNQDLALIHDRRLVALRAGENDLAFLEVAVGIRPETALLQAANGKLSVIEQNFDFDLLTPQRILEKSVGEQIRVYRANPDTGEDRVENATVLSATGDNVVLKIGDRIETTAPGRLVFSAVPASLRARPTLVVKAQSETAGETSVDLTYLTHGLSWAADYAANLSSDEKTLSLNGWVTLSNTSGIAYKNARLQLVAGNVNQVRPMPGMVPEVTAMAKTAGPAVREAAAFDYHLYTLEQPTTIKDNQTKQVSLLSAANIPVAKQYRLTDPADVLSGYAAPQSDTDAPVNATVSLRFVNDTQSNLGMPLPQGIVRVYKTGKTDDTLFLGEDSILHTPVGERVDLTLGQAFDVTARTKKTRFEKIGDHIYESAYEIEIKNAKKQPVSVLLREAMPGNWKITSASQKYEIPDAGTVQWVVDIPANGAVKLSFGVRIED